jgi:hypothetical protein
MRPESVKGLVQCKRQLKLQLLLRWAGVLLAMAAPAVGQRKDQEKASAAATADSSLKYQVRATVTDYCPVERSLNLHQVLFDFHNASCQDRRPAVERKTPTLPNGPRFRNVRIAGYHFIDWSEGHSSPNTRNAANVELSKTTTTLSASGWLEKASCSKDPSGNAIVDDTFWQARVVPEVQFVEDVEHQEPPVTVDIVPPQTSAVLRLSVLCADDREESLQYSVTPIVDGAAQPSIYTSPVLRAGKAGIESDASLGAVSIHSHWSPPSLKGKIEKGKTELSFTIVESGGHSGGEGKEPAH